VLLVAVVLPTFQSIDLAEEVRIITEDRLKAEVSNPTVAGAGGGHWAVGHSAVGHWAWEGRECCHAPDVGTRMTCSMVSAGIWPFSQPPSVLFATHCVVPIDLIITADCMEVL
jgi:hypothetical protein